MCWLRVHILVQTNLLHRPSLYAHLHPKKAEKSVQFHCFRSPCNTAESSAQDKRKNKLERFFVPSAPRGL
ncbi:hypothetical protein S245_019705 [Arachis hypogaea]